MSVAGGHATGEQQSWQQMPHISLIYLTLI